MTGGSCLQAILAPGALNVSFQPILERWTDGYRPWAVEALIRGPRGTTVETAPVLFEYARRKREEVPVDRACVVAACEAAQGVVLGLDVAINVHAATLARDCGFPAFLTESLRTHSLSPSRVVIEILEHAPEGSDWELADALEGLRHLGIRVALDDVGSGQSNYRMILDCKPDYFKVDGYLVKGVHHDFRRQAVLESISLLANRVGAQVIAECVEDGADLASLERLGIRLVQGYLFCAAVAASDLARRAVSGTVPPWPPARLTGLAEASTH